MRYSISFFGACLLLAFGTSMACVSRAHAAEWLELVGGVSKKIETNLPFEGEKDSSEWVLDTTFASVKVKILCNSLAVTEGVLKSDATALAKLSFSSCDTYIEEKVSTECDVSSEPITAQVKFEQFFHNGRDYLYVSPDTGEAFTTLKFKSGCSLAESFTLKGHLVIEDCENKFREHLIKHLIKMNEVLGTTLFPAPHSNDLKFGANAATLLGSEWIKLATGNSWAGTSGGEVKPEWLELIPGVSKKVESNLPLIVEKESKHWLLESDVAGVKIAFLCQGFSASEGILKSDGTALAKLSFSECDTLLEGATSAECDAINEPITAQVKVDQFLHENTETKIKRDYLYISPDSGEIFATIKLKVGCAIGESFNVKGHAAVEDFENRYREHLVKHLVQMSEVLGTTLFASPHSNDLKFGSKAATLFGNAWIKLENGNTWAGASSGSGAEWLELEPTVSKKIESNLPLIVEKESKHWQLHGTVAGVKLLLLCQGFSVSEGVVKGDGTALAKLSFSECDTIVEEVTSAECDAINEPITAQLKVEQFLHKERDYLYFSPDTGENFATIKLKAGCAIGESFNVKGHAVVEDYENKYREHLVKHLVQMNEALGTTLFPSPHSNDLNFGGSSATLLGSAWIKLDNGDAWAGNAL